MLQYNNSPHEDEGDFEDVEFRNSGEGLDRFRSKFSAGSEHETWTALVESIHYHFDQHQYKVAVQCARATLRFAVENCGEKSDEQVASLYKLAVILRFTGDLAESESLFERAIAIEQERPTQDALELGKLYGALATTAYQGGNLEKARECYIEALGMYRSCENPDQERIRVICKNLGSIYSDKGNFSEAESYLLEVMVGPQDLLQAYARIQLAEVYRRQDNSLLAEKTLEPAIQMLEAEREKVPAFHYLNALRTKSLLQEEQGAVDDARTTLKGAFDYIETLRGDEYTLQHARFRSYLGANYLESEEPGHAEKMLRLAVSDLERLLPSNDTELASHYYKLAIATCRLGVAVSELRSSFQDRTRMTSPEQLREEFSQVMTEDHVNELLKPFLPGVRISHEAVSKLLRDEQTRLCHQGEDRLLKAVEIIESVYGLYHRPLMALYGMLSDLARGDGRDLDALRYERRSEEIEDRTEEE